MGFGFQGYRFWSVSPRIKRSTLPITFWVVAMSAGTAVEAGDVIMFRDQPPPAKDLADIMFPQESTGPSQGKMRGIRFTFDEQPPEDKAPAQPADSGSESVGSVVGFNIQFAYGSAELLPSAVPYLDSVGEMLSMQRMRDSRILIAGHADASGDPAFNRRLSEQRALAARDYLVARYGIGPERLSVVGHGESQPLPGTDPYDGINRRVEFQPLQ